MNATQAPSTPAPSLAGGAFAWILLLFVGSGCAALIYEIVWLQLLQLVIGLTTASLGVLLGAFMGGMCLGSLLLARVVPANCHPLRVYAFLEWGIGALGLALCFGIDRVATLYGAHAGSGGWGMVLRGMVAGACLVPPTLLMGATLPAVSRWVRATPEGMGWLGFFYGGNIVGGVAGCLGAGFYLLRLHSATTAAVVAAGLNVAMGMLGLWLAHRLPHAISEPPLPIAANPPADHEKHPVRRRVLCALALSGATALGAEVVWTRVLALLLGGTVYTFSILLAVFLGGLGLGSTLGASMARRVGDPRRALGWTQLLLVPAIAWTACMTTRSLPYWPTNPSLSLSPWFNLQLDLVRALWAVLPGAVLWGASFPLALACLASDTADSGRVVGGAYAGNTLGAIAGSLLFSLVVIPWGGTQVAERLLIALAGISAALLLVPRRGAPEPSEPAWPRAITALVLVGALTGAAAWGVGGIPWGLAAYGRYLATYGNRLAPGITAEPQVPTSGGPPDLYCTYLGEGLNGTVAVSMGTSGVRSFHSAGKVQASNDPRDMRLQRMLGHLSALVHSRPESVLVVACGAGVTAGSFVVHPELRRLVICHIEPLVPQRITPMFDRENHGVLRDPRTQVVFDDGRHFIRTTQEKFDLITSDPIDPWVKGCAALNTVEYYEMCKSRLKPGGVVSLWVPLYENDIRSVRSLVATFFRVFPNGLLFSNDSDGEGYDAVLLGQVEPTRIDLDLLQGRLEREDHARVRESLADVGFHTGASLMGTYAGCAPDLADWMRGAEINTDRNLRLQYLAGMAFNNFNPTEIITDIRRYRRFPEKLFVGAASRLKMLRTLLDKSAAPPAPVGPHDPKPPPRNGEGPR
jgi:spermidine synthase